MIIADINNEAPHSDEPPLGAARITATTATAIAHRVAIQLFFIHVLNANRFVLFAHT
ncbi:MAG: hypothetical protein WCP92_04610 [bacterium]